MAVLVALLVGSPLRAQSDSAAALRSSVSEMLADFQANIRDGRYHGGAPGPHRLIGQITFQPDRWPATTVDSLLNGLENLAVHHPVETVRNLATLWIAQAGEAERQTPHPRVMDRLTRIYDQSRDRKPDYVLIASVRKQADSTAAIAFLRRVASEPDRHAEPGHAHEVHTSASLAVHTLAQMGDRGRGVLRELHVQGRVTDPFARGVLNRLAKRDFYEPE